MLAFNFDIVPPSIFFLAGFLLAERQFAPVKGLHEAHKVKGFGDDGAAYVERLEILKAPQCVPAF